MKLNILTTTFLILGVARYARGLACLKCDVYSTQYNGYPSESCFDPPDSGAATITGNKSCSAGTSPNIGYCRTIFVIKDGVVTEATRGCAMTASDHDQYKTAVPTSDKCVSDLSASGDPTGSTTCYYSCSGSDYCNTDSAVNVKKCPSNCNNGYPSYRGSCDYISGKCVCNYGWTGVDCGTTVTATTPSPSIKCVQCNSEIDSSCTTSTNSVDCPGAEEYCSTTTTTIYDSSNSPVKTVTTRGCTDDYIAADQCFFTNIFTDSPISVVGYNEVTCVSTCDRDGCNTNSADGVIDQTESIPLYCVQCTDTSDDVERSCARATSSSRKMCPSGSTHCQTTVSYLISERTDVSFKGADPGFKMRSIVRECATASVTAECTDSNLGSVGGVKIVNCTESCSQDGCNTGWPTRPNCIQCWTPEVAESGAPSGNNPCLENPPEATMCRYPYQQYCVIQDRGIEKDKRARIQGYPRRISRGCSHYDMGTGCTDATPRSTDIQSCNRTCTTDGCNVGSGSSMLLQNLAAVFVPLLLGRLLQYSN